MPIAVKGSLDSSVVSCLLLSSRVVNEHPCKIQREYAEKFTIKGFTMMLADLKRYFRSSLAVLAFASASLVVCRSSSAQQGAAEEVETQTDLGRRNQIKFPIHDHSDARNTMSWWGGSDWHALISSGIRDVVVICFVDDKYRNVAGDSSCELAAKYFARAFKDTGLSFTAAPSDLEEILERYREGDSRLIFLEVFVTHRGSLDNHGEFIEYRSQFSHFRQPINEKVRVVSRSRHDVHYFGPFPSTEDIRQGLEILSSETFTHLVPVAARH